MVDQATDRQRSYGRRAGVDTGLRTAAVWASVSDLARRRAAELGRPLRVIDLGGGTGGLSVPLAEQGHAVTVVDPSPDALASLRRRAVETGVEQQITAVQGDADDLADVLGDERADLICFHGTLEVVDDPETAVAAIATALAPGGVLSVLTAQRLAVVWSHALAGRFDQARTALLGPDGRWGDADPLPRRFDQDEVVALLQAHGLTVTDVQGVRLFSDLVPSASVDSEADRLSLLALEEAAARHTEFGFLGRLGAAVHVLATKD